MNCSVALTINKDYITLSDTHSTLLITILESVLSATIIITLYCQSFYNSQHTPSLNFAGKISPLSPSLKCPHPSLHQHACKHKLGEPTCWSVTDGVLAIVVPLFERFRVSFLWPLHPRERHLSLRPRQSRAQRNSSPQLKLNLVIIYSSSGFWVHTTFLNASQKNRAVVVS